MKQFFAMILVLAVITGCEESTTRHARPQPALSASEKAQEAIKRVRERRAAEYKKNGASRRFF